MGLRRTTRRFVRWLRRTPLAAVDLGDLGGTAPLDRNFGYGRGTPVDRRYIEAFLGEHAADVRGRVLEMADARYTRRFGAERVTTSDVLHPVPGNPRANLLGNLDTGEGLTSGAYDCAIVTQVLQYLRDPGAGLRHLHRCLTPGGVLLLTVPALSKLSAADDAAWGEYWRFTRRGLGHLLGEVFGQGVEVRAYGNVLAAVAFLEGLAVEELAPHLLDSADREYEVLVAARAVKR